MVGCKGSNDVAAVVIVVVNAGIGLSLPRQRRERGRVASLVRRWQTPWRTGSIWRMKSTWKTPLLETLMSPKPHQKLPLQEETPPLLQILHCCNLDLPSFAKILFPIKFVVFVTTNPCWAAGFDLHLSACDRLWQLLKKEKNWKLGSSVVPSS